MFLSYSRVSTEDQNKPGATSLDEQTRKNYAVAQLRGATPYDFSEFYDVASGATPLCERQGGQKLMFAMRKGDCVIANKMDRLFRSARDALVTAENLRNQGIDIILADLGIEPVTANGTAKLFFGLMANFAEFERERINERTNDGRKAKRSKHGHLGGSPPYGFSVVGQGREARLAPNPTEQDIVLTIKKLMHEHTPVSAQREAERLGLRDRAGTPFRITQLQRIAARELSL